MSEGSIPSVTIIGPGMIGSAVAQIALKAGADVQVLARDAAKAAEAVPGAQAGTVGDAVTGDIVVFAVPYAALADVAAAYPDGLAGKVVVDPSNPIDFGTGDSLLAAGVESAAAELAGRLPEARIVKAFNTNFVATLHSGKAGDVQAAVMAAGDDADAKAALGRVMTGGGLRFIDAGPLKRARELEAVGGLQIGLGMSGHTAWTGGFAIIPAE